MKKAVLRFMEKFKKDERGMTLVELLAVVVILAIVGVIAFVAIGKVIDNSKTDAHVANAQQVISAAELYEASGGEIAENMSALELDTLEDKLIDPWEKTSDVYDFTLNKSDEKITITSNHDKCSFGTKSKVELAEEGREICE